MRAPRLAVCVVLGLSAMAVVACRRTPEGKERPSLTSGAVEPTPRRKVTLIAPPEDAIPAGPEGDRIRRGRHLARRTYEELPELVGADLHCTSCHLEDATKANAGPWVGLSSAYPEYRPREGHVVSLEERLDQCFERSVNGRAPGRDSDVTKALVAYIDWLSRDVPRGAEVVGRGFGRIERPPDVDPDAGRNGYLARCAARHGADGAGIRDQDGGYKYPPLWGDRSFNIGAGMARLDTAAAFVKHDMPLGQGESLTASDAYDIAAWFIEQPRADFAKKNLDWPHGGKPPDARY